MSSLPKQRYTPQQYLAMERQAEFKSEYVSGEIIAMAGASREHILIVTNLVAELRTHLRGGSCETSSNDMRTRISPVRYTYPDVGVACNAEFEDASLDVLLNPLVIIEVLSPTTEVDDRGWKFAHYRRSPTLTDYVMISQHRPSVEHYSRHGQDLWMLREHENLEDVLPLPSLSCELRLADIYERVTFPEETSETGETRQGQTP
jgi:Uma2 family endonuclease